MVAVALIPARAGSKRIVGKNIRPLGGKPLLVWSIEAALESGCFVEVYVSTEDATYAEIARVAGAVIINRPPDYSGDNSPDILWMRHALSVIGKSDIFAILRPTSPFRTAETIRRAFAEFDAAQPVDSLRAVEPVRQHPGKMWVVRDGRMFPLLPIGLLTTYPWHSRPTQSLPPVYVQNASLEIAWSRVVDSGTISGMNIMPFYTHGVEGFDINTEQDWHEAQRIYKSGVWKVGP